MGIIMYNPPMSSKGQRIFVSWLVSIARSLPKWFFEKR